MNPLPAGYQHRADGTYARTITFAFGSRPSNRAVETLVRSASGRLLRVERTKRALSLAHRARKDPPQLAP